jgi:hypothetical protein
MQPQILEKSVPNFQLKWQVLQVFLSTMPIAEWQLKQVSTVSAPTGTKPTSPNAGT